MEGHKAETWPPDSDVPWRISLVRNNPGSDIRWVQTSRKLHLNVIIGVTDGGQWVVAAKDGLSLMDEMTDCVGLLPLLDLPHRTFEAELKGTLSDMGFPPTVALSFPLTKLVLFGLGSWGRHWPALALNWAETVPRTAAIDEAVRKLMTDGPTQAIRHHAKRLLFRRSH